MKTKLKVILITILTLFYVNVAYSVCKKSYVCDDYGYCQYMDVCEDQLDLPSIEIDPLPSFPSLEIKPLPSIELPPLGTSQCEYMQVNGEWKNICW